MNFHFLRLRDLRDPDLTKSKLSYGGRRSRRLCKILTFPLQEDRASLTHALLCRSSDFFFFFLLQTGSIHTAECLVVDGSRHLLTMWPPEKETSKTSGIGLVNYKWALAKGICHLPLPEIEPCSAAAVDLRHTPKGVQRGEWDTLLQENWWNRSLDS